MSKVIDFIKKKIKTRGNNGAPHYPEQAQIIPRDEHTISRRAISDNALKVLYRLQESGYHAFLVGGSVRDLILGREPKDFDVATDARPEQVKKLFRNCRLIGKRFRLAHVFYKGEIIEVATFRADTPTSQTCEAGTVTHDNVYGTFAEDAWRRDFTINALYYNIADYAIADCTGGMQDIKAGLIRVIGDPVERYREDPVRMLRAIRFMAKLGFRMEPVTEAPIADMAHLLEHVSNARLFDEVLKLFMGGFSVDTFALLRKYGIFSILFPMTEAIFDDPLLHQSIDVLLLCTFKNTDDRIIADKPVTPAFIFAALLWYPISNKVSGYLQEGMPQQLAWNHSISEVTSIQQSHTAIPRRLIGIMREIINMQHCLHNRKGKRAFRLLHHKRFRAAYDFLLLRAEAEPELKSLADWWTTFQHSDGDKQHNMVKSLTRRKKRKRRKKPSSGAADG